MGDGAAIASQWVLCFFGNELGDFAFVDFFGFSDAEAYVSSVRGAVEGRVGSGEPIARLKFSIKASVFLTSVE